jgi:hypothetical protein
VTPASGLWRPVRQGQRILRAHERSMRAKDGGDDYDAMLRVCGERRLDFSVSGKECSPFAA